MSDYAEYNRLLAEAKIRALQVLRDLMANCTDPVEARRIADAILKATTSKPRKRAAQEAPADRPAPAPKPVRQSAPPLSPHALGTLHLDTQSLLIMPSGGSPLPIHTADQLLAAPIPLTPRGEPSVGGGPGSRRPLPPPLGPTRA